MAKGETEAQREGLPCACSMKADPWCPPAPLPQMPAMRPWSLSLSLCIAHVYKDICKRSIQTKSITLKNSLSSTSWSPTPRKFSREVYPQSRHSHIRISISSLTTGGNCHSNTWSKPQWHGDPSVSLWEPGGPAKHLGHFRKQCGMQGSKGASLMSFSTFLSFPSISMLLHEHEIWGFAGKFHFQWLETVFWVKTLFRK